MTTEVIVVGCGVIGLTSAICLQERGFAVTIIARDLPPNLTSAAAGAYWYGGELAYHTNRHRWSLRSLERYLKLAQVKDSGVSLFWMREYFTSPMPDPWYKDHLPFFARVPRNELPPGYADGYYVEIPIVEPPRYLNRLVEQFKANGGVIQAQEIKSLTDLTHNLIINCTGVYARQVAKDPLVYPLRGQVIKVSAPHIREAMMDDDTFTYILPRRDGCILGGISQKDNWSLEVDPAVSADITRRCAIFEPSVQQAEVISEHVGLRPGRHEVRLETEQIGSSCVIHNYGHGGLGFTLSWGCANDVVELVATV